MCPSLKRETKSAPTLRSFRNRAKDHLPGDPPTMSGFRHPCVAMFGAIAFAVIAPVVLLMGFRNAAVIAVAVAAACLIADFVISLRRK